MSHVGTLTVWLLVGIHVLGLASAWLARLSEGCAYQTQCQCLFLASLGLVGLSAIGSFAMGPGFFVMSGTSLAIMVLGATWDFGGSRQVAA